MEVPLEPVALEGEGWARLDCDGAMVSLIHGGATKTGEIYRSVFFSRFVFL